MVTIDGIEMEDSTTYKHLGEWLDTLPKDLHQWTLWMIDEDVLLLFLRRGPTGDLLSRVSICCNDLFYWACADAEEITINELPAICDLLNLYPKYGAEIYACKKRNLQPQVSYIRNMKAAGEWPEELEVLPKPKPS